MQRHISKNIGLIVLTALVTVFVTLSIVHVFKGSFFAKVDHDAVVDGAHDHGEEQKQLYTCGMHPWIISEEPGDCPICGMKLTPKRDTEGSSHDSGERRIAYWRDPDDGMRIYDDKREAPAGKVPVPVYEDEIIGGVEVRIDPVIRQNMGLRSALVKRGSLEYTIRTYGHITYDETGTSRVSPKFNGWIEKLYVDFTGQSVKKGDPLFDIYSPDLMTALEEYRVAYRQAGGRSGGHDSLLDSAKRKLEYFDLPEDEIRLVEKNDMVEKTVTIRSPFDGVVIEKNVLRGSYLMAGTPIYTIGDLSRVWVEAHIYEYELNRVKTGMPAEMTLPYLPGKVFSGKVSFIYPYLQRQTRDVVIRLEFENPDLELKPDMYADVGIKTVSEEEGVVVPGESVIRSGERNIVFVIRDDDRFTPRKVVLGPILDDGMVQVLSGVAPGEVVVTSGQFLIDSESKLKEAVQKMMEVENPEPPGKAGAGQSTTEDADAFFGDMDSGDGFFDDMGDAVEVESEHDAQGAKEGRR